MRKLVLSIFSAIALAIVPAVAVVAQRAPSDVVQGANITAPADNSTVGTRFTVSGTIRADLGCADMGVALNVLETNGDSRGSVNPDNFQVNRQNNTFTYFVDITQPLVGEGIPGQPRITPGVNTFALEMLTPNCSGDRITLTVAPSGGVATGAGGSQ